MKYATIDQLDARIEKIISQKVKFYYTDWKNYDRPKYMNYKASSDRKDKKLVLIARESGTYLLRLCDINGTNERNAAKSFFEYYSNPKQGDFYNIDLSALTVSKMAI